jgi:acyl-CoA synthetase (AMP-forming)/AMP-acid ligase II/NAD(P)-dependent dehydrogenase (short-subunit alcohol dehydrogenase family)
MSSKPAAKELLPRPVRVLIGATSRGVDDGRLRRAVAGKVVLVTGASSGVGEATARRLAAAGATVLLVARSVDRLEQVRDEIAAAGGAAHVHPADLADVERVEELAAEVLDRYGQVDVLVSNAGLSIRRWVSDSYDRFHDYERTIDVNYLGPVRLILALLPSMRARRSGHIVSIATSGVNMPPIAWTAYIASKNAFETWLRGMAPEARADGVATSSIHLQLVRSPMLGPFRFWRYLPGMSPDEAAGMVARAIVTRQRVVVPWWTRLTTPAVYAAQTPVERGLAIYAALANPASRAGHPASAAIDVLEKSARIADDAIGGLLAIRASRAVRPVRPDRLARVAAARRSLGATPAFASAAAAELHGDRVALLDELGSLSYRQLDARVRALASALHRHFDLGPDRRLAIMCRNHRGFAEAAFAGSRLGSDLVPLNTDFAAPQLADVLARERVDAVVHDQEFGPMLEETGFAGTRVTAWHDGEQAGPTLDALIELADSSGNAPRASGRIVLLTSGTTGTPKGAPRELDPRIVLPLALSGLTTLARIRPVPRAGEAIVVAPPLFHLYGFLALLVGMGMGSPVVVRRRFDAQQALGAIERNRAGVLCVVPTMLKRIMDLPEATRRAHDTSSLRMIACGAAPLPPDLALAAMDELGDVVYNLYGTTEIGAVSLATPGELRVAPGTVGRPPLGITVRILDDEGVELPAGRTGRIFIGSPLLFQGYSGGGSKEVIDGLMRTGDVGHFDERGLLFVDGRDDDMIVSGGENVFPQEVEELLAAHDDVADAGVVGVPDADFGQRLAAFVVMKPDRRVPADELKSYVAAHLARHKVPRDVAFVDELPRTSTGKLKRSRLAERAAP